MSETDFVFRDPPEKNRDGMVQKFLDVLATRPGEWAVYRSGLRQNNAHVQASVLRRKNPGYTFVARKEEDGTYTVFGKIEV